MTTPPSPAARALATALREAREASGKGLREFAKPLGIRHTDLSHWETGYRIPNIETVATILGALQVSPEQRLLILEYARKASEPHWLTVGVNGIPQQLAGVVECERAASSITEWIPLGVPGLLQTPDYAREVKRADAKSEKDVELLVMVSMGRREVITRRDPVQLTAFIDESIFNECAATPMLDQFKFLHVEAQRPNVDIHIVPRGNGWHPGWAGPFVLYEFPDSSPIVHFEHYSSGAFVSAEHDVEAYRGAIERLRAIAKDATESMDAIGEVVKRMEGAK